MIARGMNPLYAVPSANRSDSGNSCSSSNSSESSSSSMSAVGTDTSYKTPVATIVDGYDGDQGEFVGGNDDGDKGKHGNESNDSKEGNKDDDNDKNDKGNHGNESNGSKEGNKDDDDEKNGDDCNYATNDVILDCAAGTLCRAPSGANLAESPHSCWGCNKQIRSSVLCGDSILNLLSNHPSFIGTSLNNGRIIEQDDNNKTRTLCFTCIDPLSGFLIAAPTLEVRKASMLAPCPLTSRVQLGLLNCDWVSQCCVKKKETPVVAHYVTVLFILNVSCHGRDMPISPMKRR